MAIKDYWRLDMEYTPRSIENMTFAQLHDLILDIKLAVTDGIIKKDKAYDILIMIISELIRR